MALIKCPECKNSVSDQAHSCPTCGYPIRKTEYRSAIVAVKGSMVTGRDELHDLLNEGWQVIDEEHEEEGPDGDGYYCYITTYKLTR